MTSNHRLPTQYQGPSSSVPYTLQCAWATAVTSVTSVTLWKGGSTVALSGSSSISGNAVTLPNLTSLTGGEEYVMEVLMTVDGIKDTWWLPVVCLKASTGLRA